MSQSINDFAAGTTRTFNGGEKVMGRFKLVKVLGQGGMGVVWLARDEELDRDVALKFLPAILVKDRASLDDLKRETRRSLDLTHAHIVRTYDFVQDEEVAGISMEYVDGDTLRSQRIDQANGVFEPEAMAEWIKQLCAALDYAHEQNIVHRDLKPANLMVNGRKQIKIADFGISRSLTESVTQVTGNGVSGTLVYMSPQQLAGDEPTRLDDVYGIGATLYELFTTRPPFYSGDIAGQVTRKIPPSVGERRQALGVASGALPAQWESAIAACLSKHPAQRPQSAGEIAVRLGLIEAASLGSLKPVPPVQPSGIRRVAPQPTPAPSLAAAPVMPPVPLMAAPGFSVSQPAPRSKLMPILTSFLVAIAAAGAAVWYMTNHSGSSTSTAKAPEASSSTVAPATPAAAPSVAAQNQPETPPVAATPAPTGPAATGKATIVVNTDPPGAEVKIGDAPPKKTPAVLSDVKAGNETVVITLDGYDTVIQNEVVQDGQALELPPIKLVRSTGTVNIESNPPQMVVRVESKTDPKFTPLSLVTPTLTPQLPTGTYTVTVTRDGWSPHSEDVVVTKDSSAEVNARFVGGTVKIESDPKGAKVFLKDTLIVDSTKDAKTKSITPLTLTEVPTGDVTYTLKKDGYDDQQVHATVTDSQETQVTVTLQKSKEVAHHRSTSDGSGRTASKQQKGGDDDNKPSFWQKHGAEIMGGAGWMHGMGGP